MAWSVRVAEVAGIAIKVHLTFGIIVALGAAQWGVSFGGPGVLFGALLVLLLFVCVTLHELGHALAARAFGLPVREILLYPLGGVAVLNSAPRRPLHELVIAAAGPLVNLVLVVMLFAALVLTNPDALAAVVSLGPEEGATLSLTTMLQWLLGANIVLVVFNLIPAFPLDGGRILRALLAMIWGEQRATRIATHAGQLLAIMLGVFSLFTANLLLGLIAIMIFFSAGQERVATHIGSVLRTRRARNAYNQHALTLVVGDRVSTAANYILTSYQPDFAVLHGERPIGIVTRQDVLRAMANETRDQYITEIMRREIVAVQADDTLHAVQETMAERQTRVVAVFDGDRYLGLLSAEDLAEATAVIEAEECQRRARGLMQAEA
jgi:Zn-dependent protease/predicted transcriptional regulator